MATRLKVQVEPLTDQRWARVEKSLFARFEVAAARAEPKPSRRAIRTLWLPAAALVSMLVLVLAWVALMPREAVDGTSRITTGETASHIALPGLSLDVQPESVVVVGGEPERSLLLVLDRGSVVCDVAPRPKDAPLIVQAGAARVRVVGTRFSVSRVGDGARVAVNHGVVEVSVGGQSWRVAAGQVWPAPAVAQPAAAAPPPSADARVAPPHEPAAAGLVADGSSHAAARAPVEAPAIAKTAAPQAPSAQAQFEQATRLERSEPARASALYAALEDGSDSWAQNALYAHGRLAATRGDSPEARRLLQRYLARYPQGTNAGDARAVLARLR